MDKQLYNANDPSTSCPITPEIEVLEIWTFEPIRQKAAYLTEYLWTDLHQRFSLVDVCMGITKLI